MRCLTIVQDRVTVAQGIILPTTETPGGVDAVGSFVSRQDAALAAGVTVLVIKSWLHRGWLDPAGERRYLRADGLLVHVDDVLDAERDTRRNRARSHRRKAPPTLEDLARAA